MSRTSRPLTTFIDTPSLLRHLQWPEEVTVCFSCKTPQAKLFQDTTYACTWHYCHNCKAGHDLLEIAETLWHLNTTQVAHRLRELDCLLSEPGEDDIPAYENDREIRRTAEAFWRAGIKDGKTPDMASAHLLLAGLGLRPSSTTDHWRRGLGQWLTFAEVSELRKALPSHLQRQLNPTWREVVLLPFWGLPGRMHTLLVIGPGGYRDVVQLPLTEGATAEDPDPGLAFLDTLQSSEPSTDVIMMTNWWEALLLQQKAFTSRPGPLPVVAPLQRGSHYSSPVNQALLGRHLTVWAERPNSDAYILATQARSSIA